MRGPVLLNFTGKKALVIGSGKVGMRRAETLAGYGCFVTCVDKNMEIPEHPAENIRYVKAYCRIETALDGMDLVVAATDQRDLNAQILENCKLRGIWCNVADDPERSDFIFPSVVRRGDLTIAVCTDGASPTLTTQIKKELEEKYDESYAERLRLLKQLRRHILKTAPSAAAKKRQLKELAELTIEELQREVEKI
ncbi:bifunctional precorrin-2 dehydrogenase/sirohydrochlorin ferrochelatase [Eubacterium sp. 1001713B170207_170306_E7]|uniref:precorrin-2 dehydrogenase/sirohydrochlorin ferrochelatase family protein n=1 Tax=Eubacterium sp. 1001713B170207_170306_E7 TaxID=2787097 RepID=UPI001899B2CD|nr:bifunctional precorrin-2 dehydrogenase/sirohydrochlorin ferrochelatase [Eubacterium sp. 1001713B170207_170306_E7]